MPIVDLHNDIAPKHLLQKPVEPSVSRLRAILAKSPAVLTSAQMDAMTRNDLIFAVRTSGRSLFPVKSIAVTGPNGLSSGTIQLVATATYDDGSTRVVTTEAAWLSSDPTKATVGAATGVVTKVAAGTTQVTATVDGVVSPNKTITVT